MRDTNETIGEIGLRFFGKMTASISHEINNVLAIINENAGILEDFTLMAKKGMPLDPEKISNVSKRMLKQIRRADGIIKRMNGFSHSTDESVKRIDLGKILELVADLSDRFASNKGVTLSIQPSKDSVAVTTRPFFLENLIWLCLDFAMDAVDDAKSIKLAVEGDENSAVIKFTQLKGLDVHPLGNFPGKEEKKLLEALEAELKIDLTAGNIILILPEKITPNELDIAGGKKK